jgi:hypothetical protein
MPLAVQTNPGYPGARSDPEHLADPTRHLGPADQTVLAGRLHLADRLRRLDLSGLTRRVRR